MRAIREVYNRTVRRLALKLAGRRRADMSGVTVRYPALTDFSRSFDHKLEFITAIQRVVRKADRVVEVGSGRGVLSVHAARQGATVVGYEGAPEMIEHARETIHINQQSESIDIRLGIIGDAIDVWGNIADVPLIPPQDLPEMDVLLLDCEGSELSIIESIQHRPRAIIVETHPDQGAPLDAVVKRLKGDGYAVESATEMGDGKHVVIAR